MAEITTKCITEMKVWEKVFDEWSALADNAGSSYFMSWQWLFSWAEVCMSSDRHLFIVVFYEKEKLVGVAPFYISRRRYGILPVRKLHFLGTPDAGFDYLDVLVKKGRERAVANRLYDFLHKEGKSFWDHLSLTGIRADSLFLLHFMNRLDAEGRYMELNRGSYCPVMQLPESESDLYAILSPGWRKKFKQDMRVTKRDYNIEHVVIKGSEVGGKLKEFFRFYEEKGGWSGEPLYSILNNVIEKYNSNIPIQIDSLNIDGHPSAVLLHVKYNKTMSMYLMAVDKQFNPKISFGNLLVGYSIINSIDEGYRLYDFLKGDERYKFHWSNNGHSTLQLNVWQRCPLGYIFGTGRIVRHFAKLLLR